MTADAAPIKGRGATFNPGNRFRRERAKPSTTAGRRRRRREDDDAPPPLKTTVTHPAGAHDHRAQRFARHSVHAVDQSVPGLRARLHLLLRAADARLPRSVAGPRLRDQALRQAQRRGAAARGAREARLSSATRSRSAPTPIRTSRSSASGRSRAQILEVLAACEHPLTIVTKSALVERDIDLLAPMAAKNLARVFVSITTLDRELARKLEPRAAAPQRRLPSIKALARRRHARRRDDRADHSAAHRQGPRSDSRSRGGRTARRTPAG